MSRPFAVALLLASGLAAPLPALAQSAPAAAAPGDSAEDAKLKALFAASDEASLKRNPVNALFRGDLRYADRLGDPFSDSYIAAERAAAQSDLAALARRRAPRRCTSRRKDRRAGRRSAGRRGTAH